MNTTIQAALLDGIINTLLDGDTNVAIVRLLRMRRSLLEGIEEARVKEYTEGERAAIEAEANRLPPIIPLRGGRLWAPSMQCPLCKAKPGKPCVKISHRGAPGVEMGEPLSGGAYHTARIQSAKEASS